MTIKLIVMLCLGIVLGILIAIPIHIYSRYKMLVAWMNTLENINNEWTKETAALENEIHRLNDLMNKEEC